MVAQYFTAIRQGDVIQKSADAHKTMETRRTRYVALLAGNGAVLAFVTQWMIDTDYSDATRQGMAPIVTLSLLGVASAYTALAWMDRKRTLVPEVCSAAAFLVNMLLWVFYLWH